MPGTNPWRQRKERPCGFINDVAAAKGRAIPLNVNGAFHSPLMENGRRGGLYRILKDYTLSAPAIPGLSNVTARAYGEDIGKCFRHRSRAPFCGRKTIENMLAEGIHTLSRSAGKTLCGLIKKTAPSATVYNVENEES
jgi:[acyl-carrier-protein] S-malonyltransferase